MTETAPAGNEPPKPENLARSSAARLSAVQALYQIAMTESSMDIVLEEFLRHRLGEAVEDVETVKPQSELFSQLVRGTWRRRVEIDEMIAAVLTQSWTLDRLETILRCALELGVYELIARREVPARVVISEYVDLANAFYAGAEPGMVNGILDRLARTIRPGEFGVAEGG